MAKVSSIISKDHPMQQVVFFLSDEFENEEISELKKAIVELSSALDWTIAPPVFVDEVDDEECYGEDEPLRTVGLMFYMYSALPPWNTLIPDNINKKHYSEFEACVKRLSKFSRDCHCEIELDIDGTQIGWIENGVPDIGIREGLLENWFSNFS